MSENQVLRSSTAAGIKFDNLPKLSGSGNYLIWANSLQIVFEALSIWPVVTGEQKRAEGADSKATDMWPSYNSQARLILMQTVQPDLIFW